MNGKLQWGRAGVVALCCFFGFIFGTLVPATLSAPDPVALKTQGPDTQGNPQFVQVIGQSSAGSTQTPISSSSTGAAAAQTATLTGVAGKTTYITGVAFCSGGATTGSTITCTITGTISGTLNFSFTVPTGAAVTAPPIIVVFSPPLPASAVNTSIVATIPSAGAGNAGESVAAWGFQQ